MACSVPMQPRGVAGVYPPAFVERLKILAFFNSFINVSPEFTLRPSLSGTLVRPPHDGRHRVAGVYPPAFVER